MIKQIRHIINSRRLRWNLSIVQISIIMSPFIDTYKWTEHYVHTSICVRAEFSNWGLPKWINSNQRCLFWFLSSFGSLVSLAFR